LAVLVLLEFGPNWLAILLALVVLASALPVEEFFQAHEERASLREGIFLTLSMLAIAAQVWLGCVRGMLLGAVAADGPGPASEALATGGSIVRYALGTLAAVSEVMCGWKLHRARTALLSPIARAVRERDHMNAQLTQLSGALHANSTGPEIRRHYRRVGARQQLAWAAGAAERARATHLKRAFKGALIALVILALLFLLASRLSAETSVHNVAVLVDLSKSVTSEDFKANINGVSEVLGKLQPSERVIILGITDKFGHPAILLDKSMPDDSGFLRLKQQAARETIMAAWMNVAKSLKPTFDHTDVLGTLAIIPYLGNFTISGAQIVIFGDLQHSMKGLDFEHLKTIPADQIIGQLKKAKEMPELKGAIVFVFGADPNGKNASDYASLRDFWYKFFHVNGAELRGFSIDRHIRDLNHIQ
jgi:outer membrane protein OmpA-like peptidoglycan-associated protein